MFNESDVNFILWKSSFFIWMVNSFWH